MALMQLNCLIPDSSLHFASWLELRKLRKPESELCAAPSAPRKSQFSVPWQSHVRTRSRQLILDRDQFAPFPIPGIQTNSEYFTLFHEDFWCLSNAFLWTRWGQCCQLYTEVTRRGWCQLWRERETRVTLSEAFFIKNIKIIKTCWLEVKSMPKLSEVQCWAQVVQWHASLGGPVDGL